MERATTEVSDVGDNIVDKKDAKNSEAHCVGELLRRDENGDRKGLTGTRSTCE